MRPVKKLLLFSFACLTIDPAFSADLASKAEGRAAAAEIAGRIERQYVLPEKRSEIAKAVRDAAQSGRYDVLQPAVLAQLLTDDLQRAGHDRHLWVKYDPGQFAALQSPLPSSNDSRAFEYAAARARAYNHGFKEQRVLEGNIRYVRISNFYWTHDVTAHVIDEVARFIADGEGTIIDLRGNGGGDGQAVERLISYFLPPDDRILMEFNEGSSGETLVGRASTDLQARRSTGKPLYVLTDNGTASAAEEFAYHVRNFRLGQLVGQTTAGAANNNDLEPVKPGFIFSISTGRPVHPVTRSNWESVGIKPDVQQAPELALDEAQLRLLRDLGSRAPEENKAEYEWAAVAVRARLNPPSLSQKELAAFVGTYGERTIALDARGRLTFQRAGRAPKVLIPLGSTLFGFPETDAVRVQFRGSGGKIIGFDQITEKGDVIPSPRTGQRP